MSHNEEPQAALDFGGESSVVLKDERYQVLCLSGGGYRGLFSACLLECMEAAMGNRRIRTRFQLIAGTSIGALIAAALAADIPAAKIRETIESAGQKIFARRNLLSKAKRLIWKAPYTRRALTATLDELFKTAGKTQLLDAPIADSKLPLVVTAVSASTHQPALFTARHLSPGPAPAVTLREAILASAAAPTYFPALKTQKHTLVDGGLIANAPDVIALSILHRKIGAPLLSCHFLSIGTASPQVPVQAPKQKNSGALPWLLSRRGLVQLTLDAQEALAIRTMELLMDKRFYRLDATPSDEQAGILQEMDRTDEKATGILKRLADDLWEQRKTDTTLHAFLGT